MANDKPILSPQLYVEGVVNDFSNIIFSQEDCVDMYSQLLQVPLPSPAMTAVVEYCHTNHHQHMYSPAADSEIFVFSNLCKFNVIFVLC